ncbi:MAG TPA: ABC transporter permease [Gemmatimonadaceae bacterium]|nr:ABC transporter permease [Gemmatimonadaceae bacterium]
MWRLLSDLTFRLRAVFRRGDADRDLGDELAHHRAMEVAHLRAAGASADAAERAAARRMGGDGARQRETARGGWGVQVLDDLLADVRYALRQMRRHPGFTAIAVLTVGLGIGATVALSSVANAVILRALPYANEDHIHVFWRDYDWRGDEYDFLRERKGVFSDLAAFSTSDDAYIADPRATTGAQDLRFVVTTPSLFDVLGVRPALGPGFTADDDRPHAPPVIVISHGMWQDDLGGDPNVIGRRILLGGAPVTIVGVMPSGFYFPTPDYRAWRPLQLDPASPQYTNGYLVLVGRTPAGLPAARLNADAQRIARDLGMRFRYPVAWDKTKDAHVVPVHTYLLGSVRGPILLLLVAVALLLVIASANTAALVLARTSDRGQEMVVRTAMGAGGWRLVRQVGAESLVLSLAAACLGAGVAEWGFRLLVARLPLGAGVAGTLAPGLAVPGVAFALALAIACAIAIAPARGLLRRRFDSSLARERSEAGLRRGARRVHTAIVAVQVTFAIMLAAGAALLIRTVDRIRALDPGFDARGVATFGVVTRGDLPPEAGVQYLRDLVVRVAALPAVTAVGITNRLPVRDGGFQGVVTIEGRPDLDGAARPSALYRLASPGYFAAMGMHVVEGRGIDSTDLAGTTPVTVVNESFARAMWPGQSAIGKHVTTGWTGTRIAREVVGVAREARMTDMTGPVPFTMFVPAEQSPPRGGAVLVVRTTAPMAVVMPEVRNAAAALDPLVAVSNIESMETVVTRALAQPLRLRFFLGVFATLAIVLSAVGVYGTVRYAVARRRAEFGIQMALGASPGRVLAGVVRGALAPVVLGAGFGLAGTLLMSRALSGFLYGVAPSDLPSLVAATGSLLASAIVAATVPAVQASRTSPAAALRAE